MQPCTLTHPPALKACNFLAFKSCLFFNFTSLNLLFFWVNQMPDFSHPNHLSEEMLLLFWKRLRKAICRYSRSWNLVHFDSAYTNFLLHLGSIDIYMPQLRIHRRSFLR
ncbi:hypothetical protein ACN38_g13061 [Penicillium nordicum]|uniref:Uncharacterized protein n=1 Tax=Penicillium nordicum TaxID=229535 RepID=A0A0M8NS73_9EURO|nr:hypothetical protein ACN38_g13061 [Penicillium nordicum]